MDLGAFLLGVAFGCLFSLWYIAIVLRWMWRNKQILTELVREIYHVDLMPFICRIEGLLNVALMEGNINLYSMKVWVEMALEQVKLLKEQILKATEKYQKYQ